jgi:two-component system nitrogen regulation response regulator GlnG
LPKDIPLGTTDPEATIGGVSAGETHELTKDNAVEILFNAAVQDPSLAILPWIEREFTLRAMQKTGDNQVRAAKLLGITRATLRKRLDRNAGTPDEAE